VPLAASRARRWTLIVLTLGACLGADLGPQLAVAGSALVAAVAMAVLDRRHRVLGALVGAVAIQVLLRLPDLGLHGASALLTVAATVPVVVSGFLNTRTRWRRFILAGAAIFSGVVVILTLVVCVAAVARRQLVERGIDQALAGLDAARAGDDEQAATLFRDAADDLGRAADLFDAPVVRATRAVPVVGQHQLALATGTHAARDLALTAADSAETVELDGLRPVDGRIDLDAVRRVEVPLATAVASLEAAFADLDAAASPWLLPPLADRIGTLRAEMDTALPDARNALAGARLAPAMLGGDGPRTWLVMFTTPAESRLLGGFVGGWAIVSADAGGLTFVDSGPSREVNGGPGAATRHIDSPAEFVTNYDRYAPSEYFQNASASPHFPSSAEVAASFYEQSMGVEIDGVINVDPIALGSIADLVGGIDELPHATGPFDGADLAQLLLVDAYELSDADQEELLDAAVEATFDALTSTTLPGPAQLADALAPRVQEGRLLMWSPDPVEQELLVTLGLDGSLPADDGHDMLLVGIANNSPNKIDVYVDRDITYDVDHDHRTGATSATATATFTNGATLDLPEEVIGNAYGLPPGTAHTYVTIFTALHLDGAQVDGATASVTSHVEQGFQTYSMLVDVPLGGSVTVTWDLTGTLTPGPYDLRHHVQPLVRPPAFELTGPEAR
jgi:Protein of unknown function (DUF4012)